MKTDHLRTIDLRHADYRLTTWATDAVDWRGQTKIAYRLWRPMGFAEPDDIVFEGDDFAGSPLHADDSDATCWSLLTFLTLRPGDTDAEYFASYTPRQIRFASHEAEAISCAYQTDDQGTLAEPLLDVWEVWNLDVWGNARDGFKVNDQWRCGTISLPHDADSKAIRKILIAASFLRKGARVEIRDEDGYIIAVDERRNGRPVFTLHRMEP